MARTQQAADSELYPEFARAFNRIVASVESVIQGKHEAISLAVVAFLAEGHLLIEDVPGVGKTMLAKAIARSTSCEWRRIQFTPDLLPSDITGVNVFDARDKKFVFKPGAVFANVVVGDEINRASPKTQSALLEAMEERQVTVDAATHPLETPFMVIATQNPIEYEGTYPLPESQLDRFMMRLEIGYPDTEHSVDLLTRHGSHEPIDDLRSVVSLNGVRQMIELARGVHVAEHLKRYIVDVVEATRAHPGVALGASPRASLLLLRAARTKTAAEGRDYVLPDDIKALAAPVLAHRLLLSADRQLAGEGAGQILSDILGQVAIPPRITR